VNRVIKFRAWDKKASQITPVEGFLWQNELKLIPEETVNEGCEMLAKDYELMQFTGLLDRNGVEIYEGDIVRGIKNHHDDVITEVYWDEDNAGFIPFHDNYEVDWATDRQEFEVIGNIYENPELLV
jgi:uncharacterized phage protein (TIGR01671 family)